MRNFLKPVLAGAAIACMLVTPALAEESTAFFEDFSTYTGGKMTGGNASIGSWQSNNWGQESWLTPVTDVSGNKGINVIPTKSGDAYTDQFVFSKFRFAAPIPDEMAHVSFQVMGNGLDSTKNSYIDIKADTATNANGKDVLYIGPSGIYEMITGKKNGLASVENGKIYQVDLIFDMKNMKFHLYVDGVQYADVDLPYNYSIGTTPQTLDNLWDIRFRWGGWVDWLDDFKIAKLSGGEFKTISSAAAAGDSTITIEFNNSISALASKKAEDYQLVNLLTGEAVTPSEINIIKGMKDSLKVTLDAPLAAATEYQLVLPEAFQDILEQKLIEPITIEIPGSGMLVQKLRFYDYEATGYTLAEEKLPAKIGKLQLWFSNPVDSGKLTKENFALKNAESVTLDYTVTAGENNSVLLTLNGYLLGDTSYTLKLADMVCDNPYTFAFTTTEGVFEVKSITFLNNGIPVTELSQVTTGPLQVRTELVKTVKEARSFVLSYSAWQEKLMKGFGYSKIEMEADKTAATHTITVDSFADMTAIKGFLWDGFTAMNAICDEIRID